MVTLKELATKDNLFVSGHHLCPGCSIPVTLKILLRSTQFPVVVSNATGCLHTGSTVYPHTSWRVNYMHSSSSNASAGMSGIQATYKALKKQGRLPVDNRLKFLVVGGDGATYDSGFSAVSGAMERGEDFVYLCCDNQMYAGSGGQRSSASPMGAATTTTPAGSVLPGKLQFRKDITRIMAAHKIPYVAQSSPWFWQDLYRKSEKAFETPGPTFINVLNPCPGEWKIPTGKSIEMSKLAADTCVWPLYEIENGNKITVNYKPKEKLPVTAWLESQDRFIHLLKSENKWIVEKIQEEVDKDWEFLLSSQVEKTRIN